MPLQRTTILRDFKKRANSDDDGREGLWLGDGVWWKGEGRGSGCGVEIRDEEKLNKIQVFTSLNQFHVSYVRNTQEPVVEYDSSVVFYAKIYLSIIV